MRVAFCIDNMNVGGTELNALRTARLLVRRGVELSVFSLAAEGPLLAEYRAAGVPVTFLPLDGLLRRSTVTAGRELMRAVRRERIGIVHAHDFYSNVFAGPWARAGGAAFIASRRWWEGSAGARRLANRLSYALANRVLANSPAIARLLVERERVPQRRVAVVPNFLDAAAFDEPSPGWVAGQRQELGLPPDALVVGSVGSLSGVKDVATLLRAASLLVPDYPALHILAIGRDAGSRAGLEALAADLGIADRVRLPGSRAQHPSPHYLFDVSVLTSVSEGLPNSVLEAMAAARPVVATNVGAVADAVLPHTTGLLVPSRDPGALATALGSLLDDASLRGRLGAAGRQRARERYSAHAAIASLLAVYASLARPSAPERTA